MTLLAKQAEGKCGSRDFRKYIIYIYQSWEM